MPTAQDARTDTRTDPYEGLDTEQRQRAVACQTAREVIRTQSILGGPPQSLNPEHVVQVAEYIVTGRSDFLTPVLLGIDSSKLSDGTYFENRPEQTHIFTGEPGEAVHDERPNLGLENADYPPFKN